MGAGWHGGLGAGWSDLGAGWADMGAGWSGPGPGEMQHRLFAMRADRPLASLPGTNNLDAEFPPKYWDMDLRALTILPEFFSATNAAGEVWDKAIKVAAPKVVSKKDLDELLIFAVTERPEAMGEILNQHQNQQLCFLQLLMINGQSHPATYYLLKLAARVGETVMMHFKAQFNRARPSQLCPNLYPPVAVPGHASYPAGHAVIARLTADCLIAATEKRKSGGLKSPYQDGLLQLASRIGMNRVYAGLHFKDDIAAGEKLGDDTFEFLKNVTMFSDALDEAQREWPQWP